MTQTLPHKMRSWLFAPGDSEKKMTKAMEGNADIALFDLEDAVTPENKPMARALVHDFLKANAAHQARHARDFRNGDGDDDVLHRTARERH